MALAEHISQQPGEGITGSGRSSAEDNSAECTKALRQLHDQCGANPVDVTKSSIKDLLLKSIVVGRDHGRIVPFVDGIQDVEKNRSVPFTVSIADLEHNRRFTASKRSRVINAMTEQGVAEHHAVTLARTSKQYLKAGIEGWQHRRSYDQRLAAQRCRSVWNLEAGQEINATTCNRPAVLFVGNECDFDSWSRGLTSFDASTSLSRTVILFAMSLKLPLLVFWVDEGFSFQGCFHPECRKEDGDEYAGAWEQ